jgi:hypothetical protein
MAIGLHRPREHRIGGDLIDPPACDPNLRGGGAGLR